MAALASADPATEPRGCAACGHPPGWHETVFNESIAADMCRCSGSDVARNRNWCDCSGYVPPMYPEGTLFELEIHGEWVTVSEDTYLRHSPSLTRRLDGAVQ